jgi:hypothetical protein
MYTKIYSWSSSLSLVILTLFYHNNNSRNKPVLGVHLIWDFSKQYLNVPKSLPCIYALGDMMPDLESC